jgi:hypothetical protein
MKLYSALAAAVRAQGVDLMFGVMGDANLFRLFTIGGVVGV